MSGEHLPGLYTFVYRSTPRPDRIRAAGGTVRYISKYSPTVTASIAGSKLLKLKNDPDLLHIEKDQTLSLPFYRVEKVIATAKSLSNRKLSTQTVPWNIIRVLGRARLNGGKGIRVGVIDTGIDLNHPDLAANIKGGVNFLAPSGPPQDTNGHGTHVAGIIGAINNHIGVVGVASKVSLYAIKVLNSSGTGILSNLIRGIEWGIQHRMHILNISIGGGKNIQPALVQAIRAAIRRGILIVAAAGNDGNPSGRGDTVEVPARHPSVIAVASLNKNNTRETYSATGNSIDISAPGTNILSTFSQKRYAVLKGTSMATAHVSGVLALLRQSFPSESPQKLKQILLRRAIDLPPKGFDPFTGAGLVQAL
ncbi:S8 family peptidase [Paenactinomyces guangxiensis]|uniref:S8 family peptidase n=1 Tax=Paenactinomyces guangxiensis TaxID=1490290 RepID=A0A7W1WNA1_9BACL|nr:S8 family peptidase [Paenactinomyces guangxiensis]MBA4492898.1 S8 family peptidase [Paenactinomyces guangxiensis]MBH8590253.1 S8 family peptidase [Paenactinomyces guangxiensis]